MLDEPLRKLASPLLDSIAVPLAKLPITPNQITYSGFAIGMAGSVAIAAGYYLIGLALILVNRLMDVLDGLLARKGLMSDYGGYLDIVLDFFFYASVPCAFAFASSHNNPAAAVLILSFVGTGTSFLAYAIICEKRRIKPTSKEKKSFYYLGGLTESTETTLFFCLCCLFPPLFSPLAYAFSFLCLLTFASRIYAASQEFTA